MPAERPGIMKILTRGSNLNKQRRYAGAKSTFCVQHAAHLHQKKVVVISFRRRNLTPPRDTSPSVLQTPVFPFDMYGDTVCDLCFLGIPTRWQRRNFERMDANLLDKTA